jgi:hypothetical protein
MNLVYILLALAVVFLLTKNMALSFISALFAILFFYRGREHFQLEPIQDNTVPQTPDGKKQVNKVKSYVPYTISPYLEVPYTHGNVTGLDTAAVTHQEVDSKYPNTDMNIFFSNVARPEYCEQGNAMYSTDLGCIKVRPDQVRNLSSRGHNMDPNHSFI